MWHRGGGPLAGMGSGELGSGVQEREEMEEKPQWGMGGMEAFSAGLVFGSLCSAGELSGCLLGVWDQELSLIFH